MYTYTLTVPFKGIGPVQQVQIQLSDSLTIMLHNAEHRCVCCAVILRFLQKGKLPRWIDAGKLVKLGNYFSHREDGALISYMPGNREQRLTVDGRWAREGRQAVKPARLLRGILSGRITKRVPDHILSSFAATVQADEERNRSRFEVLEASEIERLYTDNSFGSCMVNDNGVCKPIGEFYQSFDGCCKVLVMRGADNVQKGRALLWDTDEGVTVMDRVYSSNGGGDPAIVSAFLEHADENGWVRKYRQSLGSHLINPDGTHCNRLSVTGESVSDFEFVPYVDTFQNHSDGVYYSTGNLQENDVLTNTGGDYSEMEDDTVLCADGERRDRDDCQEIDGEWYANDECCECHRSGDTVLIADCYRVALSSSQRIYIQSRYVTAGDNV